MQAPGLTLPGWAASPSPLLLHPGGRAFHFSPRPSWPPLSLPVPMSGALHGRHLTSSPVPSTWKACFWTTSPSALSSCPTVTLLRACHAVWLRRYPLVCCLEPLVCDLCGCVCRHTHVCKPVHTRVHVLVTDLSPVLSARIQSSEREDTTAPQSPQDQAVSLLVGTGSCVACWPG